MFSLYFNDISLLLMLKANNSENGYYKKYSTDQNTLTSHANKIRIRISTFYSTHKFQNILHPTSKQH